MNEKPVWQKSSGTTYGEISQEITRPWARFVAKQADATLVFLPYTAFVMFDLGFGGGSADFVEDAFSPGWLLRNYILWPILSALVFLMIEAALIA